MTRHVSPLVIAEYNLGNASDKKVREDLLRIIGEEHPHFIGVMEAGDRHEALQSIPGYVTIQYGKGNARDHVAALVRADVRVHSKHLRMLNQRTYVGRHVAGARKSGFTKSKYVLWVVVQIDGERWRWGVTHWVPTVGQRLARLLSGRQCRSSAAWFGEDRKHTILVGDFNTKSTSPWLWPLRRLARPHTRPSHGRRAIDIIWAPRSLRGAARALDGYSSDHRPVVVALSFRKKRK